METVYLFLSQKVTVLPGHATYEQLQHPSVPLWKTVYFLNLTNPEEFKNGAKPVVNATGPYSYRWAFRSQRLNSVTVCVCLSVCFSVSLIH